METTPTAAANDGGVTGSAPLYVKPEPLNYDQHKKLGLRQVDAPFAFVAKQHFVPLLAGGVRADEAKRTPLFQSRAVAKVQQGIGGGSRHPDAPRTRPRTPRARACGGRE